MRDPDEEYKQYWLYPPPFPKTFWKRVGYVMTYSPGCHIILMVLGVLCLILAVGWMSSKEAERKQNKQKHEYINSRH